MNLKSESQVEESVPKMYSALPNGLSFETDLTLEKESKIKLLGEIHSTRIQRDAEMQTDRILEFQILKVWERIKQIREAQGFISTPIKLTVKAKKVSYEDVKDH